MKCTALHRGTPLAPLIRGEICAPSLTREGWPARHRFARPQRLAASMAGVASGEAGGGGLLNFVIQIIYFTSLL